MKGTILLVEDHRDLAETVSMTLEAAGFVIDYAADGLQAIQLATTQVFDAIILDVMLPGIDGFSVCQRLRDEFNLDTPILMLTARDQIEDKLEGFEHGADDYLVKPFVMAELVARVTALVNRKRGEMANTQISLGDLSLDSRTRKVSRAGQDIILSPTGFRILRILLRESPAVVSRDALENELWGDEVPDSDALRSHIYILRKAIDRPFEDEHGALIKTIKGVGLKIEA
ncbi:MAG: response regulator transcription factor [Arenicellales bacterium]